MVLHFFLPRLSRGQLPPAVGWPAFKAFVLLKLSKHERTLDYLCLLFGAHWALALHLWLQMLRDVIPQGTAGSWTWMKVWASLPSSPGYADVVFEKLWPFILACHRSVIIEMGRITCIVHSIAEVLVKAFSSPLSLGLTCPGPLNASYQNVLLSTLHKQIGVQLWGILHPPFSSTPCSLLS